MHMYWVSGSDQTVIDFEGNFQSIHTEGFVGEMSKIALRFRNEGKPEGE